MGKILVLLFLLLHPLATVAKQRQHNLEMKNDSATDRTTVTTKTQTVSGQPLDGLQLKIVGIFEGKTVAPTGQLGLILFAVSKAGIAANEGKSRC